MLNIDRAEGPGKPLSDDVISKKLAETNIQIARRNVATRADSQGQRQGLPNSGKLRQKRKLRHKKRQGPMRDPA